MTAARQVVPGRTYLITRRCTQRQYLLKPDAKVEEIYLYCLGEAVERYAITLHGFIAMSNHQHLVVRDNKGNFPDFLAHLHKMIAKAINAHRGRGENLWATEQPNAVYLVEREDRFRKLVYLLANPVSDHLVDRVSDWPGACSFVMHLSGRTKTVKRPRAFFRSNGKMPPEVTLRVERPEGFELLTEAEWTAKLEDAVREEERLARRARVGRVVGRKKILRANPTDAPRTREPRHGFHPWIACIDIARRISELEALSAFRDARASALRRHVEGDRDAVFPWGTYHVRGSFVIAPPPSALTA